MYIGMCIICMSFNLMIIIRHGTLVIPILLVKSWCIWLTSTLGSSNSRRFCWVGWHIEWSAKGKQRKRELWQLVYYHDSKCGRKGHNDCHDSNYSISKKNVACKQSTSMQRWGNVECMWPWPWLIWFLLGQLGWDRAPGTEDPGWSSPLGGQESLNFVVLLHRKFLLSFNRWSIMVLSV